MPDRYHTVILLPHTRAKMHKWRVSSRQVRASLAALLLVVAASGASVWHYLHRAASGNDLEKLQQENETLRQANHSFDSSIRRLQQQLSLYEERTRRLAIAAGIDTLAASGQAGIGGDLDTGYDTYETYLESVEIRAGQIGHQLDAVQQRIETQQERIAATPTIAPVRGILTCGFGYRRDPFTGRKAFHPALDISAPAGYPVAAPADGIVLDTGPQGSLGKAVYLSHGYGLTTRYGHLSRIGVRPGQRVKRGDVLGAVGNSGRATGFHLHYEVHVDGRPVDPLNYILAADLGH